MELGQLYFRLCKIAGKSKKLKSIQKSPKELENNLEILNSEVTGEEIIALAYLVLLAGLSFTAIFLALAWFIKISFIIPLTTGFSTFLVYFIVGWYPSWKAQNRKAKEMRRIPQLLNYITILLKITPNLEKAIKFAARNLERSLGKTLKKEFWLLCISEYPDARETLTQISEKLEKQNSGTKRSIDLVKSSVKEKNRESRTEILDQALKASFREVRNQMKNFASNLQLPTVVLYGVGVLMPLTLLAIIPVLSSTGINIGGKEIASIYCIILPVSIHSLKKQILSKRPSAFFSYDIPSRDNKLKATLISVTVFIAPILLTFVLDLSHYMIVFVSLWSLTTGISVFCYLNSVKTYKIRNKNLNLEKEFCETLLQLGYQLKNKYPAEVAFRRTAKISKGGEISKVLEKTSINIQTRGMDTFSAFFDEEIGSLKGVYSTSIRNTFKLLTDLLNQSSEVAGEAILHSARHLQKLREIERKIRRTLSEIVNSMKSVSIFFAPFVASVTIKIQQVVSKRTNVVPILGSGVQISQSVLLGILGFYTLALTMLLSSYIVEIEQGDDRLKKMREISNNLPIAMTIFSFGLIIGDKAISLMSI